MNVALVGAGSMGRVHADAYRHLQDAQLVAVVDSDVQRGQAFADGWGVAWYPSLRACLATKAVDVVDICTPTAFHPALALEAFSAGLHVICEKPIALTVEEAMRMIDAARRAGVHFYVAHVVRFFPEYEEARRQIQSGRLGQVGTARLLRGGAAPQGWQGWYADPALSGTVITDLMIHDFDFLAWTLGPVGRVFAKGARRHGAAVEHAFVSLRMQNGAMALVEGTWAYPEGFRTAFEFAGTLGVLQYASDGDASLKIVRRSSPSDPLVTHVESPIDVNPYQRELQHFLACMRGAEAPRVKPEDALYALRVSLAAWESLRRGEPVEVTT
ncbi:MAG: Gfo/Idh/MocA family oxidoreductase [Firmicutes bacterium]|nr:Gfo/Idh/MocA family oxidoreductase [Bacillota bacterium]